MAVRCLRSPKAPAFAASLLTAHAPDVDCSSRIPTGSGVHARGRRADRSRQGRFETSSRRTVSRQRASLVASEPPTMFMVLGAKGVVELRELGAGLVANARRYLESTRDDESTKSDVGVDDAVEQQLAPVRAWASCLDRATYRVCEGPDGLYVQAAPPEDVVQALQHGKEQVGATGRSIGRSLRRTPKLEAIEREALEADIAVARKPTMRSSGADVPTRLLGGRGALEAIREWY